MVTAATGFTIGLVTRKDSSIARFGRLYALLQSDCCDRGHFKSRWTCAIETNISIALIFRGTIRDVFMNKFLDSRTKYHILLDTLFTFQYALERSKVGLRCQNFKYSLIPDMP